MPLKRESHQYRIQVPEFDPDVHALYIEVGDKEYCFIADLSVLIQVEQLQGKDGSVEFDSEMIITVLTLGLRRKHPEITREIVDGWFQVPQAAVSLGQMFGAYMEDITKDARDPATGEALATRGLNSGPTASTTSASPRKRSAASSRTRSKS